MKIEAVMTRHVEYAAPDDAVSDLAVMMGDLDVGALPVGSDDELLGVITDRDILFRVVARGLHPAQVAAREIVSTPVIACHPGDSLGAAMDLMASNHVRRLAVRGESGKVVGWVTLADLSRKLLLDSDVVQNGLAEISRDSGG
ncbi:CBS domain-containing protein [Aureimonas sp. AU40]|uniref:CBS domain-containing protein n=1 Tax=Aureimonas sp. AU40 TaxID=1637747 RepID=UPI0007827DBE|nr:CBS domain-containing protein [Aureimonas sp. AU40]